MQENHEYIEMPRELSSAHKKSDVRMDGGRIGLPLCWY